MIKVNFKECCNRCNELDVYYSSMNACADNKTIMNETVIGCKHENVCGNYLNDGSGFKIGAVYEIVQDDFIFMDPLSGTSTKQYACGVLTEYYPDRNWAVLRMIHNNEEAGAPLSLLREVK